MQSRKRLNLRTTLVVLAVIDVIILGYLWATAPKPNKNQLKLGSSSSVVNSVSLPIKGAVEFDFLTKSEVLKQRITQVMLHSELLSGSYTPAEEVFGQIIDNKPWWGLAGLFHYRKGENSIAGKSEESRYVLNPYLLVGAHIYGMTIATPSHKRIQNFLKQNPSGEIPIPSTVQATSLVWWPKLRKMEASYDITGYLAEFKPSELRNPADRDLNISLTAYNARDFNLTHIYIALNKSLNITQESHSQSAEMIRHFIHLGGSCGFPGGCNNMSPYQAVTEEFEILDLPAKLTILLWNHQPENIEVTPAVEVSLLFK